MTTNQRRYQPVPTGFCRPEFLVPEPLWRRVQALAVTNKCTYGEQACKLLEQALDGKRPAESKVLSPGTMGAKGNGSRQAAT
jgi:hypothetical protein